CPCPSVSAGLREKFKVHTRYEKIIIFCQVTSKLYKRALAILWTTSPAKSFIATRCNMRAAWALLAFAALFGAVHGDLIEDVQRTIEDFRTLMPTGDAAHGIPPLEPISINRLPLSIKVTPFNAKVVASNIVASGASGFNITTISQRDDGKLSLSLEIPTIEVTGEYDIDGKSNKKKINALIEAKAKSFINKYLDGIAGHKSLQKYGTLVSEEWIIPEETQEMLNELAKAVVKAKIADDSGRFG
ncbi:3-methyl-2-oxobutanoate hydroxymethyltransferase, partial [Frankliniella fusca]